MMSSKFEKKITAKYTDRFVDVYSGEQVNAEGILCIHQDLCKR